MDPVFRHLKKRQCNMPGATKLVDNNPKPFFKGDPATEFSENIFVMQWLEWIRICFIATTQINWHNKHLKVKTAKGE